MIPLPERHDDASREAKGHDRSPVAGAGERISAGHKRTLVRVLKVLLVLVCLVIGTVAFLIYQASVTSTGFTHSPAEPFASAPAEPDVALPGDPRTEDVADGAIVGIYRDTVAMLRALQQKQLPEEELQALEHYLDSILGPMLRRNSSEPVAQPPMSIEQFEDMLQGIRSTLPEDVASSEEMEATFDRMREAFLTQHPDAPLEKARPAAQ